MSRRLSNNHRPRRAVKRTSRPPLFLVLLGLVGHFLRFGYVYGDGDQDELIPAALHLLNNDLFTSDWLIQYVASGINVRTYFVTLIAASGAFVPLWLGVAILHVLVWCGVAYGVYAVAYELSRDRIASSLGMLVALLVTPVMTLGGNTVIHNALVPEGIAWALVMPGIALFLKKRWMAAGVLVGLATWFHLLAGGLAAFVLGVLILWRTFEKTSGYDLRATGKFMASFVVVSLPVLIPVILSQGSAAPEGESPSYIHSVFRNPHHHLFFSFETARHLRFWPLMTLGGLSLVWLARGGRIRHSPVIARFWAVSFVLCSVSVVFVEVVPVELVARLQFFKLTVPSALFASLLISAAIAALLPESVRKAVKRALSWRKTGLVFAFLFCGLVLTLGVLGMSRPGSMLSPLRHLETDLAEAEKWARTETAPSALFAIPPTVGTFRSFARRGIVANWHAFVFDDRAMQIWYERLLAVAPITRPARGSDPKSDLDAAYHAHTSAGWLELRDRFHIDFVVLRSGSSTLSFPVAFSNQGWVIYDLRRGAEVP